MKKIPLWRQEKPFTPSVIIDYALVDDEDYEKVKNIRWIIDHSGYAVASPNQIPKGKSRRLARIIMGVVNPDQRKIQVDHKDRNILNNQKSNLRLATNQQNLFNSGIYKNNTSGYKGVAASKNKWCARIKHNGEPIHLGTHKTKEEAALAYNKKAIELFGEFALLNEIK